MNRSLAIVFASLLTLGVPSLALADGTAPTAPQAQVSPAASTPAAKQTRANKRSVHRATKAPRKSKGTKASTPPAARKK